MLTPPNLYDSLYFNTFDKNDYQFAQFQDLHTLCNTDCKDNDDKYFPLNSYNQKSDLKTTHY